jgi:hypothetical protein
MRLTEHGRLLMCADLQLSVYSLTQLSACDLQHMVQIAATLSVLKCQLGPLQEGHPWHTAPVPLCLETPS